MADAINSLAYAVVSAVARDLLPLTEPIYRFEREKGKVGTRRIDTGKTRDVRPYEDHCDIYHFPQAWGSTALGFGGLGGQAITKAYTTVVFGPVGDACVYFSGRFAYHVHQPNKELILDIAEGRVLPVNEYRKYETLKKLEPEDD